MFGRGPGAVESDLKERRHVIRLAEPLIGDRMGGDEERHRGIEAFVIGIGAVEGKMPYPFSWCLRV